MDADQELCELTYAASPLMAQERQVIKTLFGVYKGAEEYATDSFLPEEVRFTGPTLRRALLERAYAEIVAGVGGETIPKHAVRPDSPGSPTAYYSLYRVGVLGITVSAHSDERHLPRETDYRNSLIEGLEQPFTFVVEQAPDNPFLYILLQHGRGDQFDGAIPHYATYKAIDRQKGVVWRRSLFQHHAAYVSEIIDAITPEKQTQEDEIVRLRQHLRRLETGVDQA